MVDAVVDAWGKLDIGVNNAGVCSHVAVDEMGEEEWDRVIDTNLKGPFLCSLAQARVMRPNKYGKIINTASISGHIVNRPQDQTHYNTSKAGLIHLTKSLAAEWAADGIYVNSISPGYIRTEMADTPEIAKMHPIWLRDTPVGRLGEVEDLQGALIFLASDTSNFVTGCDLIVDGGFTIW
jgi:NAD(P)-dependent dehydrogenase (short-subunit alcohol dehydrogenase family)